MKRIWKIAIILVAVGAAILLRMYYSSKGQPIEQPAPKRTVEITYNFTVSDVSRESKRVQIWVPVPLTDEHQQLNDMNISGNGPCRLVEEEQFGNKFLLFDLNNTDPDSTSEISYSIKFRVTRYAVRPLHRNVSVHESGQNEPARYLASNRLIPIDGKIAEEARQVAGHLNDPLMQAHLLYEHIVETIRYDKSGTGWGRGDAVYACDVRRGNCTDFHSLFIGQARALGIPARFIIGLPLPEDKPEGVIAGYHCWGEFYLKEKGWCPVDASEANKFPQKKEQFFCGLDENRVAFTLGRDIKLPDSNAEPLNFAIYPHVEIDGLTYDNVKTSFSFKDCPP